MAVNKNKTQKTKASVSKFIEVIPNELRKADSKILVKLMQEESGEKPEMWGSAIIGFGSVHYKYASGREGDMGLVGFSPRVQNMTIYIVPGFKKYRPLLKKLGKHKSSKVCIYVNKLSDIHLPTLRKIVSTSVKDMRKKYRSQLV